MSKRYETKVTLDMDGEEMDLKVRAHVELELSGRGWYATIDGDVEVFVGGEWTELEGKKNIATAEEALETMCLEDDSDQCVEASE